MRHAVLIVGHGSRDPEGVAEFLALAGHYRMLRPDAPVEISFLEFARPTIQEGIDRLAQAGVGTIVVLPGVLMAAGHVKNDIASEVRLARQRYPRLDIRMGAALDVQPQLLELCRLRYREALAGHVAAPEETLLLLVGRGSSDPDANANIAKVARFLQEGYPAGWSAIAFSGIARPSLEHAMSICLRSGFRRIVVQPYFLFTGVLLKRIYAFVAEQRCQDCEILATPHLQSHPLLIEALAQRADEAIHGTGHMNCSLCQYRVPIIGAEERVGMVQQAHHHHVQGLHAHVHSLDRPPSRERYREVREEPADPHSWDAPLLERLHF